MSIVKAIAGHPRLKYVRSRESARATCKRKIKKVNHISEKKDYVYKNAKLISPWYHYESGQVSCLLFFLTKQR